ANTKGCAMTLVPCPDCGHEISSLAYTCPQCGRPLRQQPVVAAYGYEYRSKATLFGLPLVHIAYGMDPETGRRRVAKGIIAIGDLAIGVIALGGEPSAGTPSAARALGSMACVCCAYYTSEPAV